MRSARADVGNREEWWRSHGTEEHEAAKQIIDVARAASREARDANIFKRGRLLRNAEQVAGEQSERLRGAVPWLEDADIPADWDQANRFRMRTTKAIYDHDMQPRTRLVAELERRLEQAERAESERPSPEQVKALALRMAEQRAQAENPTQDTKRPAPSGDEPLDLKTTVTKALEHNVRTSDGMNWNLHDLVYEALSEEWGRRDGEISDLWADDGPSGYQPPSYEPVNPERRTAQTPSDGLI